jgi:hypothetical protein
MIYQGFNSEIGMITGRDNPYQGSLLSDPAAYNEMAHSLHSLGPLKNVLRFPGGTNSRSWRYNEYDLNVHVARCRDSGVTSNTVVINMNYMDEGFRAAAYLYNAGIEIILIEAGNEEYAYQIPTSFTQRMQLFFNEEGFYRDRGRQYALKYNSLRNLFKGSPFFGYVKVAPVVQLPTDAKNRGWVAGIQDKAIFISDVVIHSYYNPSNQDYVGWVKKYLDMLPPWGKWHTEFNCQWEPGGYQHMAYGDDHRSMFQRGMSYLKTRVDTRGLFVHSDWGHNLFSRFRKEQQGTLWNLVDKYNGWYE